ncbi:unnamed protein product [Alopecurus aequalis]
MVRSMPTALLDDVKGGCCIFAVGAVAGSVIYFVEGASSSSSGGCRLAGGVQAAIANGPSVRRWAAMSGVFYTIADALFESGHVGAPMNMVLAGGAANAIVSMPRGARAAVRAGLKGVVYTGVACIAMKSIACLIQSLKSSD